ncbi:hypothetical protein LCL95_10125 [Bacillus timonensis]|nr:hypothetical protein [Bacillus timonensis]
MKGYYRLKYYYHTFQYQQHHLLLKGCLCDKIKSKISSKLSYHEQKALLLMTRF